jgi:hypothetical protein
LIKDVTLTKQAKTVRVAIRWQTEACTHLEVARPPRAYEARRTEAAVIDEVRRLADRYTDAQMAEHLNAQGFLSGRGGRFTADKVQWIRYAYRIPSGCPQAPGLCPAGQRGDGRYSVQAAAKLLNVDVSTIADWCRGGRLDCQQSAPHGPRWVTLTAEGVTALRKPVRRRHTRTSRPAEVMP